MPKPILFESIGTIHSPFSDLADMPIQPSSESSAAGTIEIFPQYAAGLKDLEGFSHIYLLYYLHQAHFSSLTVVPFLDDEERGLFATRAPGRPNAIGLSLVKLLHIEGSTLFVENLDALEGTPLLDIKPYIAAFEEAGDVRTGWLEESKKDLGGQRSDARFKLK